MYYTRPWVYTGQKCLSKILTTVWTNTVSQPCSSVCSACVCLCRLYFFKGKQNSNQIILERKALPASFPTNITAAKSLQSYPTLCDPIDSSPPGPAVPGILQARTLEWVAISFSDAWKWKVKSLSRVWLLVTPWTAAYQAPLSMGFSRQKYWTGVPLPSPTNITIEEISL